MGDHICPSTVVNGNSPYKSITTAAKPNGTPHSLKNIGAPRAHHYRHVQLHQKHPETYERSYFTPEQKIPAGTAIVTADSPTIPKIFQPLQLRGLHLQNRIIVSPMCQYSAQDGHLTDWHLTHLGGIIQRGPGLTIVEATAVVPEGRITPEDSGLWKDSQIEPLRRIVQFAHSQNQHIAIQLAHAGRKASTVAPWIDRKAAATVEVGGWPDKVMSVSDVPFDEQTCIPHAMTLEDIGNFKTSFISAVHRALKAGFDAIEIHAAHGYLLHSSLSALTNRLPAPYSGSLEDRMRLLLELTALTRAAIPETMPLLVRIPGNDWMPSSPSNWDAAQAVTLSCALSDLGVDFIDVSSAGLMSEQQIKSGPGYQAQFSEVVKKVLEESGRSERTKVGIVGMITKGVQAEELLEAGKGDAVLVARAFQKNPGLVWDWAGELGMEVRLANQIGWGFGQRLNGGVKGGSAGAARG